MNRSRNLAARAAHWSAEHRKKAIFGWFAFVLVTFYVGMNVVGQKDISDIDQFSGEARDAEQALEDAGLRPVEEVVFVQSDELTVEDPEFQAAVEDVTGRLSQVRYVENVESPLTGDGEVSADGHAALVNFVIAGDSTEAKDRVDPTIAAVAAVQADHPDLAIEQVGGASADKAIDEVITGRPRQGGDALAADHADHPHHHLRHARGGRSAAADRAHLRDGRARPGRDHEPSLPGRQQPSRGRPADRAGGGCGLLALLPPA